LAAHLLKTNHRKIPFQDFTVVFLGQKRQLLFILYRLIRKTEIRYDIFHLSQKLGILEGEAIVVYNQLNPGYRYMGRQYFRIQNKKNVLPKKRGDSRI